MRSVTLTGYSKIMMLMALNAAKEPGRTDIRVHVANAKEKTAVTRLETMGLVVVDRTAGKKGEWWYSATPAAIAGSQ